MNEAEDVKIIETEYGTITLSPSQCQVTEESRKEFYRVLAKLTLKYVKTAE